MIEPNKVTREQVEKAFIVVLARCGYVGNIIFDQDAIGCPKDSGIFCFVSQKAEDKESLEAERKLPVTIIAFDFQTQELVISGSSTSDDNPDKEHLFNIPYEPNQFDWPQDVNTDDGNPGDGVPLICGIMMDRIRALTLLCQES